MSTYDDASLIMYPSGYKASKIYSLKPTDGSGDLTFTRASTATRVNSAGLIEKVRTNQVLQSQTLDNAAWSKIGSTVTANATAAPDGTTTAESNIENAALDEHGVSQVLAISAGLNTISVSVKANGRTRCRIGFANLSYGGMTADQRFAYFDVSTGTVVQNISGGLSTIVSEGNGWYRCSVSQNLVAGDATGAIQLLFIDAGINTFYTGNGTSGLFLWGGQLETGDIATPYIPTTTAAVSVGPVANIPRIDYTGGGCGKLLLEPQRTNLFTYSEQINNSSWVKIASTIAENDITSPDGYLNADKLIPSATSANHRVVKTITSGLNTTLSIFAKAAGYDKLFIGWNISQLNQGILFDLTNGTFTNAGSIFTASIENYGNGWYRCSVTASSYPTTSANFSVLNNLNQLVFTGDGTSGIYLWGGQNETASYVSSYIPTLGAAVTRGADACFKAGISSLIGQTQGTLFAEIEVNRTGANQNFELSDGTITNRINLRLTSANTYQLLIVQGGVIVYNQTSVATFAQGQTVKIAAAYKSGDITQIYVNGTSVASATAGTITGNLSAIYSASVGGTTDAINSPVRQVLVFPTRLTNTQLATITTI